MQVRISSPVQGERHGHSFDRKTIHARRTRLDETTGDGDPEGGLLPASKREVRPSLSTNSSLLWIYSHRENQTGKKEAIRGYGKTIEKAIADIS